ncbi:MAG TPA: flagellar assembly protein FliW [Pirellulales bacterium]
MNRRGLRRTSQHTHRKPLLKPWAVGTAGIDDDRAPRIATGLNVVALAALTARDRRSHVKIDTTRFGSIDIEPHDLLHFPSGLLGLEEYRHWVLLADAANDALGWLQSISHPEIAFAVVSPRRFVVDYQVRVSRGELAPLALEEVREAQVLTIVGKNECGITLNLKAPLVINLERRLGRQVVTNGNQPIQHTLAGEPAALRKTA